MLNHIIYTEIIREIDYRYCARMPRQEVMRQIHLMIAEIAHEKGLTLPRWEVESLSRQLIHDIPCLEKPPAFA